MDVICPNTVFHAEPRGQRLQESYKKMGFFWLLDSKNDTVECAICLHSDDLNEEFYKDSFVYEKIMEIGKTCKLLKHSLLHVNNTCICTSCKVLFVSG